jgi:hypothetical protein
MSRECLQSGALQAARGFVRDRERTFFPVAHVPFIRRDAGEAVPVKLSLWAESILDGILRFFDEYRPVNRSHCGVRGAGDSDTSLLLASACRH